MAHTNLFSSIRKTAYQPSIWTNNNKIHAFDISKSNQMQKYTFKYDHIYRKYTEYDRNTKKIIIITKHTKNTQIHFQLSI